VILQNHSVLIATTWQSDVIQKKLLNCSHSSQRKHRNNCEHFSSYNKRSKCPALAFMYFLNQL